MFISTSTKVRTIFVSDVHLGCKYSRAERFADFLDTHQPQSLFIVGDFLDGWRLRKTWHWQPVYNRILDRLFDLVRRGTAVYYTPGNHDEFLRDLLDRFGPFHIRDEFIHTAADGRRLLVTHGDKFDKIVVQARWLSIVGSFAYDSLCWLNRRMNQVRHRFRMGDSTLSARIKHRVKRACQFVSDFEQTLTEHALQQGCQGVVCGHIHTPALRSRGEFVYANTGDWVENCTALMEYEDGRLELVFPTTRRPAVRPKPAHPAGRRAVAALLSPEAPAAYSGARRRAPAAWDFAAAIG